MPRFGEWTKEEEETLKTMYAEGNSWEDIAKWLGKTIQSVKGKRRRLGIKAKQNHKPFTEEELEWLKEHWGDPWGVIAHHLDRSWNSIFTKGRRIGLPKRAYTRNGHHKLWPPEKVKRLTELHEANRHTVSQMATLLGMSKGQVSGKLFRLGLKDQYGKRHRPNRVYTSRTKGRRSREKALLDPPKFYIPKKAKKPKHFASDVPIPLNKNILELANDDCRYIEGEDHLFCGHQVREGSSYCPAHHDICNRSDR